MQEKHPPELPAWERLGGTVVICRVVDLFVDRAIADSQINYERSGQYPQTTESIARTKKFALAFLSSALGGPFLYSGRSLPEVHRPMGISESELDAFLSHFREALVECAVPNQEVAELMDRIQSVRPAILGS